MTRFIQAKPIISTNFWSVKKLIHKWVERLKMTWKTSIWICARYSVCVRAVLYAGMPEITFSIEAQRSSTFEAHLS